MQGKKEDVLFLGTKAPLYDIAEDEKVFAP